MNSVGVNSIDSPPSSAPQREAAATWPRPGDPQARFTSVVLPYLDDAWKLARWLTGNDADSEDVVQEACQRAFRGIAGFSGSNARAWVLTIVRHTAYSWMRKNRPAAVVLVEDLEAIECTQSIESDTETPETAAITGEYATLLEAALATLPLPLREALVLREVHELSYREIAEVAGVSIGTVTSRLFRARGRITLIIRKAGARPH